jgi:hypothetical protein
MTATPLSSNKLGGNRQNRLQCVGLIQLRTSMFLTRKSNCVRIDPVLNAAVEVREPMARMDVPIPNLK